MLFVKLIIIYIDINFTCEFYTTTSKLCYIDEFVLLWTGLIFFGRLIF